MWVRIYSTLNIECCLKYHILGSKNKNIDWALSVFQYCVFKEWVNSNNQMNVSEYSFLRGVTSSVKMYVDTYKLCHFTEVVKYIVSCLNKM